VNAQNYELIVYRWLREKICGPNPSVPGRAMCPYLPEALEENRVSYQEYKGGGDLQSLDIYLDNITLSDDIHALKGPPAKVIVLELPSFDPERFDDIVTIQKKMRRRLFDMRIIMGVFLVEWYDYSRGRDEIKLPVVIMRGMVRGDVFFLRDDRELWELHRSRY
jgi:hypothetical protein